MHSLQSSSVSSASGYSGRVLAVAPTALGEEDGGEADRCERGDHFDLGHSHPRGWQRKQVQRVRSPESCRPSVSDGQREPMSLTPNAAVGPDRGNLPLKKRDQRWGSAPPPPPPQQQQQHQHQQQCDAATFKAPYPYRRYKELKTIPPGPSQPIPKRVPALYQPWIQTPTPGGFQTQVLSAFREHHGGPGWAGWAESGPLHFGWDFPRDSQHDGRPPCTPASPPGVPRLPCRAGAGASRVDEAFQRVGGGFGWERLKTAGEESSNARRLNNGRNKGPYVRRGDGKLDCFAGVEKAAPPPQPPREDLSLQRNGRHKTSKLVRRPATSSQRDAPRPPALTSSVPASSSSSSPNRFPWLLPHFVAGSLIELGDGRLRRVEHLQTEDFLLGSLACPDLRLSCCTVQSIVPSASTSSCSSSSSSSSSSSRLLILLHDQQSQELVDVYDEYPFFVRGRGWSSCSPQRTARLCGLQCHRLGVGDVCLALTPVSAPRRLPAAASEPGASAGGRPAGGRESLEAMRPKVLPGPGCPAGEQRKEEAEVVRRRRHSAPELRGPGTTVIAFSKNGEHVSLSVTSME